MTPSELEISKPDLTVVIDSLLGDIPRVVEEAKNV
jgi:hypothetical protein